MAKKKSETILLPIFEKATQKRLEANPLLKTQIRQYKQASRPYDYEQRIDDQLAERGLVEEYDGEVFIDPKYNGQTQVKSVVIDGSFEKWFEKEGKQPSMKVINEYMTQITDDEANSLLEKYHLNMNLSLCVLPIVVMDDNNNPVDDKHYILSANSTEKIHTIIGKVYGSDNVWVPGVIMPADDLDNKREDLLNKAHRHFSGDDNVRMNGKYKVQKNFKKNRFFVLCMPFVVKNEFNSSVYTIEELFGEIGVPEMKTITYATGKVNFLGEYSNEKTRSESVDIKKMTFEQFINAPETSVDFSFDRSGLREILTKELPVTDTQTLMFFRGWGEHKAMMVLIDEIEEDSKDGDTKYFVFDSQTSYIDQFEKYFSNHRTASDILCFLDALGSKITDLCEGNLDLVPDEEKENIVIFIDYINERFYETIYRTMMDKYGDQLEIFGIAEYFRFEMTAMQMKEDLSNIDEDLVQEAQKIVRKIWIPGKEQTFTFAIVQGQESHEDCLYKSKVTLCEKADETLYIALVHYCAAMMMCGGGLSVRTYREDKKEEVFGIKGGNWDWDVCSEEEIRWAYTRLPDGSFLEPDKNTVFTEITKD